MMTSVVRGGFGIFRIAPPLTIDRRDRPRAGDLRPGARQGLTLKTAFPRQCHRAVIAFETGPLSVVPAGGFRPTRWECTDDHEAFAGGNSGGRRPGDGRLPPSAKTAAPAVKAAAADYQAAVPPSPPAANIRAICYNAADLAHLSRPHGAAGTRASATLQCQNAGGSRAYEAQYGSFIGKFQSELSSNSRACRRSPAASA